MTTHWAGHAALALIVTAGALSGPAVQSTESGVVAALTALRQAGLHRDVAALDRMYALDYFHTNPDGSLMSREKVLASYRAPATMSFSATDTEDRKVLLRSAFAIVSERLSLHGKTAHGAAFVSRYRVTYVLEHKDGAWQFLNSHSSLLGIDSTRTP